MLRLFTSWVDLGNSVLENNFCCFYLDFVFVLNYLFERSREVGNLLLEVLGEWKFKEGKKIIFFVCLIGCNIFGIGIGIE